MPRQAIRKARLSRVVLKNLGAPTDFERKLMMRIGAKGGILFTSSGLGTFKPVIEGNHIIGYYRAANGFCELKDREGKRVWSDEKGIHPSLISPVDIFGPGLVRGVVRGVAFRVSAGLAGAGLRRAAGGALARALAVMRNVARRILNARVVVEIGAGDLKASLHYLRNLAGRWRNIRFYAVEPDKAAYQAGRLAELRKANGVVVQDTHQLATGIADDVFQYFPYDIGIGGEGMVIHAPHKIVSEAMRIARRGAAVRYVTWQKTTADYLVAEAKRLGAKGVTLSKSTVGQAAPGASAAGVPRGNIPLGQLPAWVVKFIKGAK